MSRIQKLGVAIGKKGVGKTYATTQMLHQYVVGNPTAGIPGRKVLIMDVNDEFENIKSIPLKYVAAFSVHPQVEIRRIRPFKDNGAKMTLNEFADTLFFVLETFKGGLILIEDVNKYTADNMPNDLIGAICTNRHSDLDIILHYQSIGRITPKVWQNLNWIRFHKIQDKVSQHKQKYEEFYEMFSIAETLVDRQYKNNMRYHLYIDIDDEKIRGKISKEMIDDAINIFIEENYKKTITPLLQQYDTISNKKKYTAATAYDKVKQDILTKYF